MAAPVQQVDIFGRSEEEVIGQLRAQMVDDLSYRHESMRTDASSFMAYRPPPPSAALAQLLPVADAMGGGEAKRDALSALLSMKTREIEATQRERCARASRQLMNTYQQNVARLQAALIKNLSELGAAGERAVDAEMQAFMQLGLPAIQHILTDSAALQAEHNSCESRAADAALANVGRA